ncbi:MAG TPA: GNAT family N-acetyltransferase [Thermoanaerobaculia bacterium]|jgi:hypothetical protein
MIDITFADSVENIAPHDWERACASTNPLWQRGAFASFERAGFGADGMRYLIVREDDVVRAIVPFFWFRAYPLDAGGGGWLDRSMASLRTVLPRLLTIGVLFAGNPIGTGWPDVRYGPAIAAKLRETASQLGLPWLILKDLSPRQAMQLADEDSFAFASLPDTRLTLGYATFDDYLAALPSAARRNARSKLRRFAASGLRLEVLDDFAALAPRLEVLYANVLRRAKVRLDRVDARFFAEAAHWPETSLVTCFDGNTLAGFLLVTAHDGEAIALRVGLDYTRARDSFAYFAMHYEAIRHAIDRRYAAISFCQSTYGVKRELGCALVPLAYVATHRNAAVRAVLRGALPRLLEHYMRACGLTTPLAATHVPEGA